MSNIKYFIYSKNQFKERSDVEARLGRKFYAGTLILRGRPIKFTQIVSSLDGMRYSDYKVVAQVDVDTARYTTPYAE